MAMLYILAICIILVITSAFVKISEHLTARFITQQNKKIVAWVFSADLGWIWCAESKNHIGFAQQGQVFELLPRVIFFVFVHVVSIFEEIGGVKFDVA